MSSDVERFATAIQLVLGGEPASLILAANADLQDLPSLNNRPTVLRAYRAVGPILEVVTVGGSSDVVSALGLRGAESLAKGAARVALCELTDWAVEPLLALQRARRADSLLQHEMHQVLVGTLDPVAEVVRGTGKHSEREACERVARGLVDEGDLGNAGFCALEIDEPVEDRRRWLAGLVSFAQEIAPASPGIDMAVRAAAEQASTWPLAEASYAAFDSIRSEILAGASPGGAHERALYVSELCMKVSCNLAWLDRPESSGFDRDTGWWILRSALAGSSGEEHRRWFELLFPLTAGLW